MMHVRPIMVALVIIVALGLAAWYVVSSLPTPNPKVAPAPNTPSASGNAASSSSGSDTTASIQQDLNQTPSDSSAQQQMDQLNANVQGF